MSTSSAPVRRRSVRVAEAAASQTAQDPAITAVAPAPIQTNTQRRNPRRRARSNQSEQETRHHSDSPVADDEPSTVLGETGQSDDTIPEPPMASVQFFAGIASTTLGRVILTGEGATNDMPDIAGKHSSHCLYININTCI